MISKLYWYRQIFTDDLICTNILNSYWQSELDSARSKAMSGVKIFLLTLNHQQRNASAGMYMKYIKYWHRATNPTSMRP